MPPRDPLRDIVGTCAAQICAFSTTILSPLVVGGLIVGLGVSELDAGGLITVELLVVGVTSLVLAPWMAKFSRHRLALLGGIVLLAGQLLSISVTELTLLYPYRIMAGFGAGVLIATLNTAIARAQAPVLLYGLAWAASYVVTALLAVSMTAMRDVITYGFVYTWLSGVALVCLPLLWFVPRYGGNTAEVKFPRENIVTGTLLMLGLALIGISMMAYYAFLERLAVVIGASAAESGRIVAAVQISGIIGGLIAAPLANRFSLIRTLVVVTLLHAVAIAAAIASNQVVILGVAAFLEALLFITMVPLMLALSATIDRQGRWAAAAGGVIVISTALGPVLGAALIEELGYVAIGWLQVVSILAVYLFVRVARTSIIIPD